jgi:hypothetical protein
MKRNKRNTTRKHVAALREWIKKANVVVTATYSDRRVNGMRYKFCVYPTGKTAIARSRQMSKAKTLVDLYLGCEGLNADSSVCVGIPMNGYGFTYPYIAVHAVGGL